MNKDDQKKYNEDIKKLVIARLDSLPQDVSISIGSAGAFTKNELIKQIQDDTEIGHKMIEIELEYLRKLKEGIFYATSPSNH